MIDNLDRIDPAEALAMWASMRTFFEFNDAVAAPGDWPSRVWLIAPFDRGALQRLWKNEPAELVQSFVNKTFDITYETPSVTLTRRKQFFQDELRDAIPGQDAPNYDIVYLLADRYRAQLATPREIKLFVNRLVALHLQWQGQIALPLLALYLLVPDALGQRISPAVLDLLDDKQRDQWQAAIAAIQFNVPIDEAGEAIDGPRILQALETGQSIPADLYNRKWFWEVCARVVRDRTTEWEAGPDLLANSIRSLQPIESPAMPENLALAGQIWETICDTANRSGAWKIDEHFVDAILALGAHSTQKDAERLYAKLLTTATDVAPPAADDAKLADWVRGAIKIFDAFALSADYAIELGDQWPRVMLVPGASNYIGRFSPADPQQALFSLIQLGFQGVGGESFFTLIDAMKSSGEWPWTEIANVETPWQTANISLDSAARGVRVLLAADPNAAQPGYASFQKLTANSRFTQMIDEAQATNRYGDAARLAFALLSEVLDPNKIPDLELHPQTIHELFVVLDATARLDIAATMALSEKSAKAGREVVNEIVKLGRGGELAPIADRGLHDVGRLLELMPDTAGFLIAQLVQSPSFASRLMAAPAKDLSDSESVQALRYIYAIQSFPGREQLLQRILQAASQDSKIGPYLLQTMDDVAGTAWLPLSMARDHKNIQVSATREPELYRLLNRRIDIGDQTTAQLLAAAESNPALYDLAIDRAKSDAALNPNDAGAQVAWGRALASRARYEKGSAQKSTLALAEKRFHGAIELNPGSAEARKALAEIILATAASRASIDDALNALEGLDDPILAGRAMLARARLSIGEDSLADSDAAISHFRDALAADPANVEAQAGLGAALSAKAQRSTGGAARELYEEARQQFTNSSNTAPEVLIEWGRALLAEARAGAA